MALQSRFPVSLLLPIRRPKKWPQRQHRTDNGRDLGQRQRYFGLAVRDLRDEFEVRMRVSNLSHRRLSQRCLLS
jgi:hypothetical protein